MAKNSRMALCCQNQVSKGTNQRYGLHVSACISVHNASVTVLGLLKKKNKKKKELVQNAYTGSCIDVRRTCTRSFIVANFTQLKKKCLQTLTSLAVDEVYYYSYFIHGYGHSHTLTIATGGARTYNEPVMSRRSKGEHKLL